MGLRNVCAKHTRLILIWGTLICRIYALETTAKVGCGGKESQKETGRTVLPQHCPPGYKHQRVAWDVDPKSGQVRMIRILQTQGGEVTV
jgi:hypothetical protein